MKELVILYILNKYDLTIYRLLRVIDELFFAYLKASAGTINPALKRLEKLGCVRFNEKMSDGGMLSKIYSITPEGKKHLCELLLSYSCENPYHVFNEASIAIFCSDVLSINELISFKENMLNVLELHKIKLKRGIENKYIDINELQKNTIRIVQDKIDELINLL